MPFPPPQLVLNDGWQMTPPKEDGEYWFGCDKPWDYDQVHEPHLVKISNGLRVAEREHDDEPWHLPDDSDKIWDDECQHEMVAVWRKRLPHESFSNPPPKLNGVVFNRYAVKCPHCKSVAAVYEKDGLFGRGPIVFACHHCETAKLLPGDTKKSFAETIADSFSKGQPL